MESSIELLEQYKAELEREKIEEERTRRSEDRFPYERINSPGQFFEHNGGSKKLFQKAGVIETFGPWPFFLSSRDPVTGEQAEIFFGSPSSSSKFGTWSNSSKLR